MKKTVTITILIIAFGLFAGIKLYSLDGELIGKVGEIHPGTAEIYVFSAKAAEKIKMGTRLYVRIGDTVVVMASHFPMQTVAKCRLLPEHAANFTRLTKGMPVYLWVPGVEKKEEAVKSEVNKIGDMGPAGGFIFYDKGNYSDGWRYLEAAPIDQGTALWGCNDKKFPGARGTGIGTGKQNTQAILNGCTETDSAAKLCADYRGGGKSDWFLPSKDELDLMYKNLKIKGIGSFTSNFYWSSSEFDEGGLGGMMLRSAWTLHFDKGVLIKWPRGKQPFQVRAIRAF